MSDSDSEKKVKVKVLKPHTYDYEVGDEVMMLERKAKSLVNKVAIVTPKTRAKAAE